MAISSSARMDANLDAANLGLVRNVPRHDLHDERSGHLLENVTINAVDYHVFGHGDAGGCEYGFGVGFGQRSSLLRHSPQPRRRRGSLARRSIRRRSIGNLSGLPIPASMAIALAAREGERITGILASPNTRSASPVWLAGADEKTTIGLSDDVATRPSTSAATRLPAVPVVARFMHKRGPWGRPELLPPFPPCPYSRLRNSRP